ncbi:MAG: CPBP family intramembrane metalloprotease [Proteobacteria bacterium]|nr:CPBP family intramembrane metalloprotease [Pseudomonadota bacterium]
MPSTNGQRRRQPRLRRPNLLTTIILVLPLLIFYELGTLLTRSLNGVDLITRSLLRWLGPAGFVVLQLSLLLSLLVMVFFLRRGQRLTARPLLAVLVESTLYALTMGTFIVFVVVDLLGVNPLQATGAGHATVHFSVIGALVVSAGAGVHEELVFRAGMLSGLSAALRRWGGMRSWLAAGAALLISSLVFAAAHHPELLRGEVALYPLIYRTLAGAFFAAIYLLRGFATAVYTHAIYDAYVLLLA